MLLGERHLLRVAGLGPVLLARAGSLVAAFYTGRWLSIRAYGRWHDFLLGGVLGYAPAGLACVGLALLFHAVSSSRGGRRPLPPASPDSAPATGPARGALARETLFGLTGVFTGVAGLLAGITDPARLTVAVAAGAVATAAVAVFLRWRP